MFARFRHRREISIAYECFDQGELEAAVRHFEGAIRSMPSSWEAHFGLGVVLKWLCRWEASLEASSNATSLRPGFEGSWWNVGIAATALGRWRQAREAWNEAGVESEVNDEPLVMKLGRGPIRLKTTNHEVVWCDRIDPARARIVNVPTAESQHRYGDILLADGEPVGTRRYGSQEVPVFNELQILQPSSYGTYATLLNEATFHDADSLVRMGTDKVHIEDWSTMRYLCQACSEGRPHDHHDEQGDADLNERIERRIAFAAESPDMVEAVLRAWQSTHEVVTTGIQCLVPPVISAPSSRYR
jgi:tetratricopeptide (TPR) repeat protein